MIPWFISYSRFASLIDGSVVRYTPTQNTLIPKFILYSRFAVLMDRSGSRNARAQDNRTRPRSDQPDEISEDNAEDKPEPWGYVTRAARKADDLLAAGGIESHRGSSGRARYTGGRQGRWTKLTSD